MTKPLTLLLSGLFAALCWMAADMLLVGFVQSPEQYPLFSHTLASALGDDVDLAVLMLAGRIAAAAVLGRVARHFQPAVLFGLGFRCAPFAARQGGRCGTEPALGRLCTLALGACGLLLYGNQCANPAA